MNGWIVVPATVVDFCIPSFYFSSPLFYPPVGVGIITVLMKMISPAPTTGPGLEVGWPHKWMKEEEKPGLVAMPSLIANVWGAFLRLLQPPACDCPDVEMPQFSSGMFHTAPLLPSNVWLGNILFIGRLPLSHFPIGLSPLAWLALQILSQDLLLEKTQSKTDRPHPASPWW